ncbi:MAG: HicB family protein [Microcystis aeruginosa Ma_QC_C_20070703_M131]|uniref:HicB family protein n=1 Tax=Microcystis aeruginosa Ma_QC_C_20070703_M131 TaxID=2486263 RepID=A0A551YNR7_MICAE|nr:MAG: HicB family protein [Microcystis aeruginosa Ma_QC_C_20070703_M131]
MWDKIFNVTVEGAECGFYDFPGCISAGETIEEAKKMATEALKGHISFMLADGDEIPTPSTLETILTDADHQDAIAFLLIEVSEAILNHQELSVKN